MCRKSIDLMVAIISLTYLLSSEMNGVCGHGRLVDPPSRSSAWRYGFDTEPNYNDNQLFCGGFTTQWKLNQGKCGICGDPFNGRRDNELPNGKYAKKLVITRTYKEGDVIQAKVEITANHNGFFVFKICPATSQRKEVTQKCLDRFLLEVMNSNSTHKYVIPSTKAQMFSIALKLPVGLTCRRCLFQWTYISANNWGKCENGKSAVGCGPQETFRGCADIKIIDKNLNIGKDPNHMKSPSYGFTHSTKINRNFETTKIYSLEDINNLKTESQKTEKIVNKCHSIGIWKKLSTMDEWCSVNCAANYCPPTHCNCL